MANRWGKKMETVTDFIFLGSKITADCHCSHEIKRRLLFGRKAMTSLDGMLKSRDITFLTKFLIVKAMVFPVLGSLPMSQLFTSCSQTIGASAAASVLPMNIQDGYNLGFTGLISLQSKGLSRVFSSTTVQKQQFFTTQLSLWSNSHICIWLLEEP